MTLFLFVQIKPLITDDDGHRICRLHFQLESDALIESQFADCWLVKSTSVPRLKSFWIRTDLSKRSHAGMIALNQMATGAFEHVRLTFSITRIETENVDAALGKANEIRHVVVVAKSLKRHTVENDLLARAGDHHFARICEQFVRYFDRAAEAEIQNELLFVAGQVVFVVLFHPQTDVVGNRRRPETVRKVGEILKMACLSPLACSRCETSICCDRCATSVCRKRISSNKTCPAWAG